MKHYILIDFSQISMACLMQMFNMKHSPQDPQFYGLLRHMIFNSIRVGVKHRSTQPSIYNLSPVASERSVVIATDDRKSWRKDLFPFYKASRTKTRSQLAPGFEWADYFAFLAELIEDIRINFPYITIRIETAEGDDIIGTLVRYIHATDEESTITIVSGDKDFKQLHFDDRIEQFSPVLKKPVVRDLPSATQEMYNLIVMGDRGDGVPNVLSDDDTLVTEGKRSKSIKQTYLAELLKQGTPSKDDPLFRNWERNNQLVNLARVPREIQTEIITKFNNGPSTPRPGQLFGYFGTNQLVELQNKIGEFV